MIPEHRAHAAAPSSTSNSAPHVAAADAVVKPAQSIPLASLISATDADGDDIIRWAILDKSGGLSGHLTIGGETIASGSYVEFAAAQLGEVRFVGGAPWSFDFLEIRVFDGSAWSDPDTFQITTLGSFGKGGWIF